MTHPHARAPCAPEMRTLPNHYFATTPPPQDYHWLPDMDSNHDWVSQSHLCYHYTIRQESAEGIPCGVRAAGQGRKRPSLIFPFFAERRARTKKSPPTRGGQAGRCLMEGALTVWHRCDPACR